jgi:cbb3-type cytochrome oxidase subunit 1
MTSFYIIVFDEFHPKKIRIYDIPMPSIKDVDLHLFCPLVGIILYDSFLWESIIDGIVFHVYDEPGRC